MNSKVTFLMMAYNTEEYIEKAVRSVLNQTEPNINIIVRNNGSTDGTGSILATLEAEDKRVRVVSNRVNGVTDSGSKGFTKEWWYGEENLLGEYVTILDSDDWVDDQFVEKLYQKAKTAEADITYAGNYFVLNNEISGKRLPHELKDTDPKQIGDDFPRVHACFRTWWGKLFRKDFFVKYFDWAWCTEAPMWWTMDTLIMMKYLGKTQRIANVCEPLYYMRQRGNSTYSTRALDLGRLLEAHSLHRKMNDTIQELGISSPNNAKYVDNIHWGYLYELFPSVIDHPFMSMVQRYHWMESMVLDEVFQSYVERDFLTVFSSMLQCLDALEEKYAPDENIYSSYMARLNAYVKMLKVDDCDPLAYVVLMGVLCDPQNSTGFGKYFLSVPQKNATPGITRVHTYPEEIKKWFRVLPTDWIWFINALDRTDEVVAWEKELYQLWSDGAVEQALDMAIQIVISCPLNLPALLYLSLCYRESGEDMQADLLTETLMILWDNEDIDAVLQKVQI